MIMSPNLQQKRRLFARKSLYYKTVLIAVREHRGRYYEKAIPVDELDLNLAHTTNDEDRGDDVDDEDDEVDDEVENVEEEVAEE